jgi:hypothetical protein
MRHAAMLRVRNGDAGVKVFVSYGHAHSDWVQDRLVPVLETGGASVFVDYRHFAAGHSVIGRMDTWQDQAERHVLVPASCPMSVGATRGGSHVGR